MHEIGLKEYLSIYLAERSSCFDISLLDFEVERLRFFSLLCGLKYLAPEVLSGVFPVVLVAVDLISGVLRNVSEDLGSLVEVHRRACLLIVLHNLCFLVRNNYKQSIPLLICKALK